MRKDYILPLLRGDLVFKEYTENSEKFIILHDPKGYVQQPVSIPVSILPLFNLIDGKKNLEEYNVEVRSMIGDETDFVLEHFLNLIEFLDYYGFMDSDNFKVIKADIDTYLAAGSRKPACMDNSYPSDPQELSQYLDGLFSTVDNRQIVSGAKSIMVPHIDFRIGEEAHRCYAAGYHAIRDTEADLFVILGTSHQVNSDFFMMTYKNFETPLGIAETDNELIDEIKSKLSFDLTIDDMAHRHEHSIEFQVVLLQHYFKDRNFRILPVLVGSFHNFIYNGTTPSADDRLNELIDIMSKSIQANGRKVVFIASADMAHIGRKFRDNFDAESHFPRLREDDSLLLKHLESCDADSFFKTISEVQDKNKICGLSPAYSLLKICNPEYGKIIGYDIWNEKETNSAVSFSSIAYY
jgi:MEMO1 family protein